MGILKPLPTPAENKDSNVCDALDNSSDARGGIGRMTPATLLLHDKLLNYVRLMPEDEAGHTSVLRCALRGPMQEAYCFAEVVDTGSGPEQLRIFTECLPPQDTFGW